MGFADTVAIPAVVKGKDRGRYIKAYRDHAQAQGYELVEGNIENLTAADLAGLRDPASAHRTTAAIELEDFLEPWQTDQFINSLDRAPDDRPWFAVCSFNAPHFPFAVPRPYDSLDRPELDHVAADLGPRAGRAAGRGLPFALRRQAR